MLLFTFHKTNGSLLLTLLVIYSSLSYCYSESRHQSQNSHKSAPGWQEPGLWRPKWIMDRYFDETDGAPAHRDRICFKLKNDRTMKIYNSKNRKLIEYLKEKTGDNGEDRKSKNIFESAEMEDSEKNLANLRLKKKQNSFNEEIEGTWWWQDLAPIANQGKVKLETREGPEGEKIRHDINCDWGKIDPYAAKFRKGKILKYKTTESGIPLGTEAIGTFSIRVTPHRPLVAKDFTAFQ